MAGEVSTQYSAPLGLPVRPAQLVVPAPGELPQMLREYEADPQYVEDANLLYQMFTRDLNTSVLPEIAEVTAQTAAQVAKTELGAIVSAQEITELLADPLLSAYVQHVRTLESNNANGLVMIWLRQSHAEVGFGPGGVDSGIAASSVQNQEAIAAIGEALAEKGVRFFGVENFSENLNSPSEFELPYADRPFTTIQSEGVPPELTELITEGFHQDGVDIDFFPGALALQALYPALDVIGVDRFRDPIRSNGLFVESEFTRKPRIVTELENREGDSPETFYREVAVLPGGEEALKSARAYYQQGFNFFSITDDGVGLDSVGAALAVSSQNMNSRLQDPVFLGMARRSGGLAPNVMAIQYGAVHSGIIDRALGAGMDVVDVIPVGLDMGSFDANYNHYQKTISEDATRYFSDRIRLIEEALER